MKGLKNILSIFKYDAFGHQFFLRIGRKNKNSTAFSLFFSYLLLILMLLYFLLSSFNTFNHANPTISIQDFDVNQRSHIHLDSDNFHFAFRIEDNAGNPMAIQNISDYFDIQVTFYSQVHNETSHWKSVTENAYEFEPCLHDEFLDFEDYYQNNLKHAYCLKNHSFDLGGFWDEETMSYLYMTINMCNESESSCVGRDAISEIFKGSYLTFYVETQNVDGNDYENPAKKSLKYYSYLLDTNIKKDVNFYIKEVRLQTSDALFFNREPSSIKHFFKQNQVDLDFNANFNSAENNVTLNAFWEIYIYPSNQIQIVDRTYTTLTEVFASVGGISKFLLIIGTFITLYYNEMLLQSELLNELFVFDFEENSETKRKRNLYSRGNDYRRFHRTFSSYLRKSKEMAASDGLIYQKINRSPRNQINLFNFQKAKNDSPPSADSNDIMNLVTGKIENEPMLLREEENKINLNPLNSCNREIQLSRPISLKNVDENNQILMFSETENQETQQHEIITPTRQVIRNKTFPLFQEMNSTKRHLLQKELEERRQNLLTKENLNSELPEQKEKDPIQQAHFDLFGIKSENKEIDPNNEILTEKQLIELHLNKSLKFLNEAKSSKKNKLKFSFLEIIRSVFFPFCLSRKHENKLELYKRASDDLMKYINIKELVQTLQQLEKLKVVIFNKNQLALFNFLSKPMITLDGKTGKKEEKAESFSDLSGTKVSRIMRYMQGNNIKEQCKDIISYYNNLLETEDYSEIDKKLFELLDDDFRAIIDRFGTHRDTLFPRNKSEGKPPQFSPE